MIHTQFAKPFIAVAIFGLLASACASTPDPAKICTADWITPRADRAVKRIESRAGKSIKALRKAGESWSKGKKPGFLTMMSLQNSLKNLETELTEGKGITDLRTLAKTCDDPQIVTKSVRTLFERQGVPQRLIDFVENSPIYERVLGDVLSEKETKT